MYYERPGAYDVPGLLLLVDAYDDIGRRAGSVPRHARPLTALCSPATHHFYQLEYCELKKREAGAALNKEFTKHTGLSLSLTLRSLLLT